MHTQKNTVFYLKKMSHFFGIIVENNLGGWKEGGCLRDVSCWPGKVVSFCLTSKTDFFY